MIRVSKEELYSAMGERLRGERTKLGYTQEKMAEKLGMSLTYYGQIERGISGISLEKLVLAHECLNIDPTYLLTGKERPVVSFDLVIDQCPKRKQNDLNELIQYALKLAK